MKKWAAVIFEDDVPILVYSPCTSKDVHNLRWKNVVQLQNKFPDKCIRMHACHAEKVEQVAPGMHIFDPPSNNVSFPSQADLSQDKAAEENAATCVVCWVNVPCCIAAPCNHLSYCVACARNLCLIDVQKNVPKTIGQLECCICKQAVQFIKRVYY